MAHFILAPVGNHKKMKKFLFILTFVFGIYNFVFSQTKDLYPNISELHFSKQDEQKFNEEIKQYDSILQKLDGDYNLETLTEDEKQIFENFDETIESYWDIIGGGCSWYCGGGPKEVTGSSSLQTQNETTYAPENAHDLQYNTVWSEGSKGNGIGEYLLYHFSAQAARITEINVVNGYVKSESLYYDNSRAKTIKVYINNKEKMILHLEDKISNQSFSVDTIGTLDRENWKELSERPDWTIKFEITDIYPGRKYNDLVISEIYFDGIDVHCFVAGTKISLANGNIKPIEEIQIGDSIKVYDINHKTFTSDIVTSTEQKTHCNLIKYTFADGSTISATDDHPFLLKSKDWASLNAKKSSNYSDFQNISQIEIGDLFIASDSTGKTETKELTEITQLTKPIKTYTISGLKNQTNNFIAEGFVVGVEKLKIITVANNGYK